MRKLSSWPLLLAETIETQLLTCIFILLLCASFLHQPAAPQRYTSAIFVAYSRAYHREQNRLHSQAILCARTNSSEVTCLCCAHAGWCVSCSVSPAESQVWDFAGCVSVLVVALPWPFQPGPRCGLFLLLGAFTSDSFSAFCFVCLGGLRPSALGCGLQSLWAPVAHTCIFPVP